MNSKVILYTLATLILGCLVAATQVHAIDSHYKMRFKFVRPIAAVTARRNDIETALNSVLATFNASLVVPSTGGSSSELTMSEHGADQTLVQGTLLSSLYTAVDLRFLMASQLNGSKTVTTTAINSSLSVLVDELKLREPTFNLYTTEERITITTTNGTEGSGLFNVSLVVNGMSKAAFDAISDGELVNLTVNALDTFPELVPSGFTVQREYHSNTTVGFTIAFANDTRPASTIRKAWQGELAIASSPILAVFPGVVLEMAMKSDDASSGGNGVPTPSGSEDGVQVPTSPNQAKSESDGEEDDGSVALQTIVAISVPCAFFVFGGAVVAVIIKRRMEFQVANSSQDSSSRRSNNGGGGEEGSTASTNGDTISEASGSKSHGSHEPTAGHMMTGIRAPMPTSDECSITEALVLREAESNSQSWSLPMTCASGHPVEKTVTVVCDHCNDQNPKKITDIKTLFGGHIGHIWKCAKHDHATLQQYQTTAPPTTVASVSSTKLNSAPEISTNDPYLQQKHTLRQLTLFVNGVELKDTLAPKVIYNTVPQVFDGIARCLRAADHYLETKFCLGTKPEKKSRRSKTRKIDVQVHMKYVDGTAANINGNAMDADHQVVFVAPATPTTTNSNNGSSPPEATQQEQQPSQSSVPATTDTVHVHNPYAYA